ncbi:MAG: HEAT repeat domain-containing protein [Pirellulaceae bacterium]|jgi:HEAT repeat protein|nr:HEAT repeat domain-containing protein [Thermoguttaceae bacterium]MDI9445426.1 HEAT repeat domain-containing protein [Planctomycetota bacterium]NLZ03062.1 HEAT repeat domain-containing protein [Pirellulaceae bacterium]
MPGMHHRDGHSKSRSSPKWGVVLLAALGAVAGCDSSTANPTIEVDLRSKREIPASLPAEIAANVELLYSADAVERVRGASRLGALGRAGAPAVPFLIDALADPNWQVRQQSAEALGSIADEQAAVPLIAVLTDREGDWGARAAAARALGALKSPQAVEPLASVLNDMNAHVRQMAAISLGQIGLGMETATAALEMAARSDPDVAIRFAAAESLRRLGQPH